MTVWSLSDLVRACFLFWCIAVTVNPQVILIGGPHLGLTVDADGKIQCDVGTLCREGVGPTATCGAVAGLGTVIKAHEPKPGDDDDCGGKVQPPHKKPDPSDVDATGRDMEMDRLKADFKKHLGINETEPVPADQMENRTRAVAAMNWNNLVNVIQTQIAYELGPVLGRTDWTIQTIPCMVINVRQKIKGSKDQYHTILMTPTKLPGQLSGTGAGGH